MILRVEARKYIKTFLIARYSEVVCFVLKLFFNIEGWLSEIRIFFLEIRFCGIERAQKSSKF